jgi:tol-pal system protein YbgF
VLKYYPQNDLAGNALFYQAEIAYRQGSYQNAIEAYSSLLLQYPGNSKAPAAMLRQGQCLLALGKRDAAIHQFHALIQRYPKTPEAVQAHSKLDAIANHPQPEAKPTAGHSF